MILQHTRRRMMGRAARLGLAAVAVAACIGVQPARAQADGPCTYSGAQALLFEGPVAATQSDRSDRPHLGELWRECQFRLYRDGETVTFRQGDYILGAIAVWWSYQQMDEFGLSRAEAIDDLELVTDQIEIAVVTDGIAGPFEPVPVIVTSYRDAQLEVAAVEDAAEGHIVFNQRGFISQLPAGEYLVRWTQAYPGFPDFVSTVRLLVTPA